MKPEEIRNLADSELSDKVKDARDELFKLRFRLATGQLDNPQTIKTVKRELARLHTEVRSREIEAERAASAAS